MNLHRSSAFVYVCEYVCEHIWLIIKINLETQKIFKVRIRKIKSLQLFFSLKFRVWILFFSLFYPWILFSILFIYFYNWRVVICLLFEIDYLRQKGLKCLERIENNWRKITMKILQNSYPSCSDFQPKNQNKSFFFFEILSKALKKIRRKETESIEGN